MDEYPGFAEFVAAHTPTLSRLAYLLAGDHASAEDLLQVALTKAALRWRSVREYDSPEAFVRTVMYHEAVTGWRRRRRYRERVVAEPPEPAGMFDEAADVERRVVLERALRRLTPRQRAVLVLRFYEDRTPVEAARLLGCSVGTVKSQTHHALARLRLLAPELSDLEVPR
jgi:RNA polymerase sigma-70 factor (sigma-E family)